jgi:uroporphyrinogen-III synthase
MPPHPAVVLTRERPDNAPLAAALERRGVPVVQIPCTSTRYVDPDPAEVEALPDPGRVGALAFTSRRGVEGWVRWVQGASRDAWPRRLDARRVTVAAVGRRTAAALAAARMSADVVADPPRGVVMARQLAAHLEAPAAVVVPGGRMRVREGDALLARRGFDVRGIVVYVNEEPPIEPRPRFDVGAVFVASPSAARRLLSAMEWMRGAPFVSIGPTTTDALVSLGVGDVTQAEPHPESWERMLWEKARRNQE